MLDQVTVETFEPFVGSSFWVEFPNGAKVELRLVGAAKVMESEAANLDRHPFSLYFIGPRSYPLRQQIYRLTHPETEAMELFLVPIGTNAEAYQYEAVFT
jgi:hypothetical protein